MILRCTPARACIRHLARGVAVPREGDPCGPIGVEEMPSIPERIAVHGEEIVLGRPGVRKLQLIAWALAEQLLAVTAERDALRVRLDEEIAARRDRV